MLNTFVGSQFILATGELEYLFDLTPQLISDSILTLLAVITLFFCLSYFLFNPAREMLRKRSEKIQDELDSIIPYLKKIGVDFNNIESYLTIGKVSVLSMPNSFVYIPYASFAIHV